MKYKVGDKVRIVSKWVPGCQENSCCKMDKWLGKVMTIRKIDGMAYKMVEDEGEGNGDGWFWHEPAIECLVSNAHFTRADLKNGDIVKFDNGQIGVVIKDCDTILLRNDVLKLSLYKDDMSQPCAPAFTIKAVKRPEGAKGCYWDAFNNLYGELVYDRESDTVVEMTMEEICAALGKNIKIVKEK